MMRVRDDASVACSSTAAAFSAVHPDVETGDECTQVS